MIREFLFKVQIQMYNEIFKLNLNKMFNQSYLKISNNLMV